MCLWNAESYLKQQADGPHLLYRNFTPWPFSNRDAAIFLTIENNVNSISITQTDHSLSLPVSKELVRISRLEGKWTIKEEANGFLSIKYIPDKDPCGSIPIWLANLFISKEPYKTIGNPGKLLKQ